jgi:hypothetical protein
LRRPAKQAFYLKAGAVRQGQQATSGKSVSDHLFSARGLFVISLNADPFDKAAAEIECRGEITQERRAFKPASDPAAILLQFKPLKPRS